jgi:hypothetical protein
MGLERVGIDCEFYINSGSIASPTMGLVDNIRDVTISQEWAKAEFKTRARINKRYRKTLVERTVEFQIEDNPDLAADAANFLIFKNAFESQTATIICAMLDGLYATAGSKGLHAAFQVDKFQIGQPLEDAVLYDVSLSLALFAEEPEWLLIAA